MPPPTPLSAAAAVTELRVPKAKPSSASGCSKPKASASTRLALAHPSTLLVEGSVRKKCLGGGNGTVEEEGVSGGKGV